MTGCSSPGTPTAASAAPSGVTRVAGTVFDGAFRTISGARIEALEGTPSGAAATTDAHGYFELRGTFDEKTRFRASKEGLVASTGTFLSACARCDVAIYLGVDAPPLDLAGAYTLTFAADSTCPDLPSTARRRTYATTIVPEPSATLPPNTWFQVIFTGASFLRGHDILSIHSAGDYISWTFEGGVISEQVADNAYVTFAGKAAESVGPAGIANFAFPLEGSVEYCELKSPTSTVAECNAAQAALYSRCASTNHRLILERR